MKTVSLTRGYFALVDDEDYTLVSQYKWRATPSNNRKPGHTWYAATGANTKMMHRMILGIVGRQTEGDHINGNGLDNRRQNLRVATKAQQRMNAGRSKAGISRYRGVSFYRDARPENAGANDGGRWRARLTVNGKEISRYSGTEKEAALAYNVLAKQHFGEFARMNDVCE